MPLVDMPLAELQAYRPEVREPADFDEFWRSTLDEARSSGGRMELAPWEGPLELVDVWDVTFPGFGGHPIKGWLTAPHGASEPLPAVVEFQGYGGGRGLPHERLYWPASGLAHLLVDTRGQGSGWGTGGSTPDPVGSVPHIDGRMTMGIDSPSDHYYRRFFTDGVRAVDLLRELPFVDADRVAVAGGSQGGGAALAVGALVGDVAAIMADVPFLCHFERAVEISWDSPYEQVQRYLRTHRDAEERVFQTLSYFDGANFARRISAPTSMSVALMDPTCPASTVYAAANRIPQPPSVSVYKYNGHEGGEGYQWLVHRRWLHEVLSKR